MNWNAIGASADVIGVLAVIVSIVYLAIQVKHANSIGRANARQAVSQMNIDTLGASLDPQVISVASMKATKGEKLSPEELSNYVRWIWMRIRVLENAYYQHVAGLLDEDEWQGHSMHLITHLGPGSIVGTIWETASVAYSKAFVAEVERILTANKGRQPATSEAVRTQFSAFMEKHTEIDN